jgi:NADH dehydrogenase
VAASWTFHLFLPPDLVSLTLEGSQGVVREHFEPGQDVFREGDRGDRHYIILQGEVEVRRRAGAGDIVLGRLGAGQCFGEMALLHMATRNASVRCVSAVDVLSIPSTDFAALSANLPELRRSFEKLAEERAASAAAREPS